MEERSQVSYRQRGEEEETPRILRDGWIRENKYSFCCTEIDWGSRVPQPCPLRALMVTSCANCDPETECHLLD